MIIIRHNKLKPPFDDYIKLDLFQLDQLATDRISPDIQGLPDSMDIDLFRGILSGCDKIFCSSSSRTQQTCYEVQKLCGLNKSFQQSDLLNEIFFSPLPILKEAVNPLQHVRDNLYSWIREGNPNAEAKSVLHDRIRKITTEFMSEGVVCFSHGFLIRLLKAYIESNMDFELALKFVDSVKPVDYLEITKL